MSTPTRRHDGSAALLTGRAAAVALAAILTASFMELLDATIVSVAAPRSPGTSAPARPRSSG